MADLEITFTIKEAIKNELVEMVNSRHPCPTDENGDPEFTDGQWAKEYYRRLMKRELLAYRRDQAGAAASPPNEDDVE